MTVVKKPLIPTTPSMPNKPLSEKECKAMGLPHTSKAKPRLGCPDDWSICWTEFGLPTEDHQNVKALAKSLGIPVSEMCARIMQRWFQENREEIYAEAEASMRTASTEEDLEKKIEALRRSLDRTVANLELKRKPSAE